MPREPIMLHQLLVTNVGINVKKYLEWLSLLQFFSLDAVKGARDP